MILHAYGFRLDGSPQGFWDYQTPEEIAQRVEWAMNRYGAERVSFYFSECPQED